MPTLRLDVPEETVRKLDMETDLLGFDDVQEYLSWIIGNRAAIEQGTERDQLLTEYAARVEELEAQIDTSHSPEATQGGDDAAEADGGRVQRGTGEMIVSGTSAGDTDHRQLGGNFRPERVERFTDEDLDAHAGVLSGVEGERLDEFARRAVAQTRERLGRDPTTGLSYSSNTTISTTTSDVSLGADIADLGDIEVPGRSTEKTEPRREAVGAALAYLKDVGSARRSDFVDELYEEFPAGYGSEAGWWECIKTGLKQVDVVEGGDGRRVWRFRRTEISNESGTLKGRGPKRIVDSG
ncbi:hypothetical protein [Haloarchaeobius sp. HME9146]|uniref:hypothetical protein n=1 Tax=Haloarchaeobius sp. HME9146 TaxID=2978732 RepID=UPI0021BFC392|nr:hypothetical protein [Haloarchaeobius sp. HME9146]MCT9096583.1 hypothetical protein [Haloarchaeobius sp. HME9146]